MTLLHYAVNLIRAEYPELIDFADEILDVNRASLVNYSDLQCELQQICAGVAVTEKERKDMEADECLEDEKPK